MLTEADLLTQGYTKLAKNLWTKPDADGKPHHFYQRMGELADATGLSSEDARKYGVDLAKLPKDTQALPPVKTGAIETFTPRTASLNKLTGKHYEEARALIETTDDALVEKELRGEVLDEFVYRFKQGNEEVTGLTYVGIREIAKRVGRMKVTLDSIQDKPDSYIVIVKGVNLDNDVEMPGLSEQSKWLKRRDGSKDPDPFALQKAHSKAVRNCLRTLIPETQAIVLLKKWLDEAGSKPGP